MVPIKEHSNELYSYNVLRAGNDTKYNYTSCFFPLVTKYCLENKICNSPLGVTFMFLLMLLIFFLGFYVAVLVN